MHFTCYFNHWTAQLQRNARQTWNQTKASRRECWCEILASDISLVAWFIHTARGPSYWQRGKYLWKLWCKNYDIDNRRQGERTSREETRWIAFEYKRRVSREITIARSMWIYDKLISFLFHARWREVKLKQKVNIDKRASRPKMAIVSICRHAILLQTRALSSNALFRKESFLQN